MKIPKSWDEITISQFKELQSIQSDNELTAEIERISILTDSDPEEIRSLPIADFNKLRSEAYNILSTPIPNEPKLKIEVGGKKFGMIPDLNFISAGEWVDIENFSKDSNGNIHLICAVLWRPIIWEDGDDWKISPHTTEGFQKRADLFLNNLPITAVWGGLVFFSTFATGCMEIILDYSAGVEDQK